MLASLERGQGTVLSEEQRKFPWAVVVRVVVDCVAWPRAISPSQHHHMVQSGTQLGPRMHQCHAATHHCISTEIVASAEFLYS